MLNEQKLKQIQAMVQNATVLSAQEKTEWLALIELMNDKQISELEEILQKPKPIEVPLPPSEVQSSSLSHISNLPSMLSDAAPAPPLSTPPAPTRPVQTISAPSVSAPTSMPTPTPQKIDTPMPPVNPLPAPKSITMTLSGFDDIPNLTSSALHNQNREVFHKTINDLAGQYGYFQVVTAFEQSPLYKDYLDYGKSVLSGKKDGLALSQEEFEFVTDILLSLKVNRF